MLNDLFVSLYAILKHCCCSFSPILQILLHSWGIKDLQMKQVTFVIIMSFNPDNSVQKRHNDKYARTNVIPERGAAGHARGHREL